jgi:hypothetical protein
MAARAKGGKDLANAFIAKLNSQRPENCHGIIVVYCRTQVLIPHAHDSVS